MATVKQSFPDITKSAEDGRNYKGLELKNGLKVVPELFLWSFILSETSFLVNESWWSSSTTKLVYIHTFCQ